MPARLRTPICDLFGIDVPIILAGMGGVSMAPLVAAVSNAGGLGVIGAANLAPEELRAEIRRVRALTDRPFGVDLLAPLPQMLLPHLPVLYDEGVPVFVAGLAVPEAEVPEMKRHGLKIMVMTGRGRTWWPRRARKRAGTPARSARSRWCRRWSMRCGSRSLPRAASSTGAGSWPRSRSAPRAW